MRGAAILLVLLAGCFNPDDIFPIHGRLSSPAGVEGQSVRLLRGTPTPGNFTCKAETPFKETTAAADGTFSFDVFRAQAQSLSGLGGRPFCFRLETQFVSGTEVSTDLQVVGGPMNVPVFEDWQPNVVSNSGVLDFSPAAIDPPDAGTMELTIHRATLLTADGGTAWTADDLNVDLTTGLTMRNPITIWDVAVEDFDATLTLRARRNVVDEGDTVFGGNAYTLEYRAGQTLSFLGTRTPLSRDLSCAPLADPCPYTDGSLERVESTGSTTSLTLSLATPASISAIVLRGVETEASLMGVLLTAADGTMLTPIQHELPVSAWGSGQPEFIPDTRDPGPQPTDAGTPSFTFKFPPAYSVVSFAPATVRTVRLVFPRGLQALQEVSLFP